MASNVGRSGARSTASDKPDVDRDVRARIRMSLTRSAKKTPQSHFSNFGVKAADAFLEFK
jgi:hypothetical protein